MERIFPREFCYETRADKEHFDMILIGFATVQKKIKCIIPKTQSNSKKLLKTYGINFLIKIWWFSEPWTI